MSNLTPLDPENSSLMVDESNTTANQSDALPNETWTFSPICVTTIFSFAVLANILSLVIFIREPRLHSPFAVYLMWLLGGNILYLVLQNPLDITYSLYQYNLWWTGWIACTVYIYGAYVATSVVMYTHALIAFNRVWALTFPHSYRSFHTQRVAVLTCVIMSAYVHAILMPGIVLDAVFYRLPLESNGCAVNTVAQPVWAMTIQFLMFNGPECLVLIAYPYVFVMHRLRKKVAGDTTRHTGTKTRSRGEGQPASNTATHSGRSALDRIKSSRAEHRTHPIVVLTLLTAGVLVFWTPQNAFYTVWVFIDVSGYTTTLQVVNVLQAVEAALDPVLFALALRDLRKAFRAMFRL